MLNRTSSHICDRWYLPVFLLRDGLLTLMCSTSFIALLRFWSSLPLCWKGRCLLMFFESLSKCSWEFSNIFLITIHPITLVSVNDSTLLLDRVLIFWSHQEVLDGMASSKVDLHSMFAAYFLQALIFLSSDMRKPCWKTGESLSPNSKNYSVLEKIHIYIISNRMRNMHLYKIYIIFFLSGPFARAIIRVSRWCLDAADKV